MTIVWDPKTRPTVLQQRGIAAREAFSDPARNLTVPDAPHSKPARRTTEMHPAYQQATSTKTLVSNALAKLRADLRDRLAKREAAAKQILSMCVAYPFRRSRGARKQALEAIDDVIAQYPDATELAEILLALLEAEHVIHLMEGESTLEGIANLTSLLASERLVDTQLAGFAKGLLAGGLVQLALHFPIDAQDLELPPEEILAQAFSLAEEAIANAPELPDGYVVLGRLLLIQEEVDEAETLFELALSYDPEHDAAQTGLATAAWARGELEEARELVEPVLMRGSGHAGPWWLSTLIAEQQEEDARAVRDLVWALKLAPECGLLRIDAARVDTANAEKHHEIAKQILGVEDLSKLSS